MNRRGFIKRLFTGALGATVAGKLVSEEKPSVSEVNYKGVEVLTVRGSHNGYDGDYLLDRHGVLVKLNGKHSDLIEKSLSMIKETSSQ